MGLHQIDVFGSRLTVRLGEPKYSRKEVLKEDPNGQKIVRSETEGNKVDEVRYSYMVDGKEVVFIRGHKRSTDSFHVNRIENATKDKFSGKYLTGVFSAMEEDLKTHGIRSVTTLALVKIAPILVKRYGFHEQSGMTPSEVDEYRKKENKPGLCLPLEKFLND